MFNTFIQASNVRRAYSLNGIIYKLKTMPVIRKIIPYSEYKFGFIKTLGTILMVLSSVAHFCWGEFIYLGMLCAPAFLMSQSIYEDFPTAFMFLTYMLAFIGIALNTVLFEASEDKYYAILLLRMDARKYVLSDMIYNLIRKLVGNFLALTIIGLIFKLSPLYILSLIVITLAGKPLGAFIKLKFIEKNKLTLHATLGLCFVPVIGALMYAFYYFGILITVPVALITAAIILVLGIICGIKLWNYKDYLKLSKFFLKDEFIFKETAKQANVKNTKKLADNMIATDDVAVTSNKSGYAMFNELFVKRHSKILRKRTNRISLIVIAATVGFAISMVVLNMLFKDFNPEINILVLLYTMPLLMYFLNSGESLTTAMFVNCDAAMLTYNFYRKPSVVLGVFRQRLKTTIYYNTVPAILISVALCVVNYFVGDSGDILTYVAFFVICPAMAAFFSIHRLVIYYLLQPFTEGLDKTRGSYNLANYATYFVSYMIFMARDEITLKPIIFAGISVAFTIVYIFVALLLVYKFAPKKFKIHKAE